MRLLSTKISQIKLLIFKIFSSEFWSQWLDWVFSKDTLKFFTILPSIVPQYTLKIYNRIKMSFRELFLLSRLIWSWTCTVISLVRILAKQSGSCSIVISLYLKNLKPTIIISVSKQLWCLSFCRFARNRNKENIQEKLKA